jgi:hypothetical protein
VRACGRCVPRLPVSTLHGSDRVGFPLLCGSCRPHCDVLVQAEFSAQPLLRCGAGSDGRTWSQRSDCRVSGQCVGHVTDGPCFVVYFTLTSGLVDCGALAWAGDNAQLRTLWKLTVHQAETNRVPNSQQLPSLRHESISRRRETRNHVTCMPSAE